MNLLSNKRMSVSTFAVAGMLVSANPVFAQDDGVAADENSNVIIVTATRRAENLQDVPSSVSAVTLETINSVGATDISDLAVYLPNFEINNSTVLPNLYVRGLGSGATHSIEQSVGRFVDELYMGRAAMNLHGFFDIEAVELLRGPQGTLFGKNTAAGALIIRTAAPTRNFEAGIDLTYGDYSTTGDYQELEGFVSGPLSDSLRARLAVRYARDDGYYINRLGDAGPSGPDREDQNIRLRLEWDAGPNTLIGLKLEHQRFESDGSDAGEFNAIGGPPTQLANILARSPGFNTDLDWIIDTDCTDIISDMNGDGILDGSPVQQGGENAGSFCPLRDQEMSTAAFRVDHDFEGAGTLTTLFGYQEYSFDHRFFGIDMGVANAFRGFRNEDYNGITGEVRFTSEYLADSFDFIVGAYYEDSELSRFQTSDVNFFPVGFGPIILQRNEPWTQDTETFAVFGQVRYDIMESLRLIVGGRYSHESKDYVFDRFYHEYGTDIPLSAMAPLGPFDAPLSAAASRSESRFTPAVTLQYFASDDLNFYASYSRGHKTGGFSDRIDRVGVDFEFDAENHTSYELGLNGTFFDGDLSVNLSLFHVEVEGLQLATQVPGTIPSFSVDNAAAVTSQGIEFDAQWRVNDFWTIGADYAYTDAAYDDFSGTPACPASAMNAAGVCDLAGFPLIYAPMHKGSAFIEVFDDTAFGEWGAGARVNVSFSDEYFTDIAYGPASFEDGYGILDASIRLVSPGENYSISLIGRNLTEEVVLQWGIPSGPNSLAALRAPREIALRFSARF